MTYEQRLICKVALKRFGAHMQSRKLMEEMAELQVAILHFGQNRASEKDIITELADVRITLEQMIMHFGESEVEKEINYKTDRLKQRMHDECD